MKNKSEPLYNYDEGEGWYEDANRKGRDILKIVAGGEELYRFAKEEEMTKREEYIYNAEKNYNKAIRIMIAKSDDYAQEDDPYANFRGSEFLGIDLKRGILVRVMDKITRLNNLIDREAQVKESVEDTCLDAMNYINIVLMKFREEGKK